MYEPFATIDIERDEVLRLHVLARQRQRADERLTVQAERRAARRRGDSWHATAGCANDRARGASGGRRSGLRDHPSRYSFCATAWFLANIVSPSHQKSKNARRGTAFVAGAGIHRAPSRLRPGDDLDRVVAIVVDEVPVSAQRLFRRADQRHVMPWKRARDIGREGVDGRRRVARTGWAASALPLQP